MGGDRAAVWGKVDIKTGLGELDWTVCRALLSANSKAMHAMELQMLQSHSKSNGRTDEAVRALEKAVVEHEAIVEDLTLAIELLNQDT